MSNQTKLDRQDEASAQGMTPKLRFPEFREAEEWKEKQIDKLLTIGSGKDYKHLSNGDIPVYGSGGYMRSVDDYLYDGDSVCIGRKGTIDKPIFLTGKFWTVDTLFFTHSFKECLPKFIYFSFQKINWLNHSEAGGIPSLSKTTIGKIEIPIPSSTEQKKIADCLSSLDELITAQTQKLDSFKTLKKGLMQQLFPAEGETLPKLRFPEFRDTPEWRESQLEYICQMQAGKFVTASDINEEPQNALYPCFGGNGLRGFTKTHTHTGKYPLIGRQGALCGNVTLAEGKFHATEHAVVATPMKNIDTDWLYYLLTHLNLNQYATGQAQPGLSVDNLKKIPISVPEKEQEQQKIAGCLSSIDELVAAESQQLGALKAHKKGLMQQLFPSTDEVNG